MPWTPNTTWVDGSGGGTPLSAARLNNMEAGVAWTWENYTPTWASSGTSPSIGNATVSARYAQRGKLVVVSTVITYGNTTTFGTGTYTWALPVTAAGIILGHARVIDSSAGFMALGSARVSGGLMEILYETAHNGGYTGVGAAAPYVLASGDSIAWAFAYEAS